MLQFTEQCRYHAGKLLVVPGLETIELADSTAMAAKVLLDRKGERNLVKAGCALSSVAVVIVELDTVTGVIDGDAVGVLDCEFCIEFFHVCCPPSVFWFFDDSIKSSKRSCFNLRKFHILATYISFNLSFFETSAISLRGNNIIAKYQSV